MEERHQHRPQSLNPEAQPPPAMMIASGELVDAPHDPIVKGQYNISNHRGRGYLAGNITWYRKHFNIPSDWKGQSIWVYFEGVFRASVIYFNDQTLLYHDSGYTSFSVRLDNASKVNYGEGASNENVIAIRADATHGFRMVV